MAEGGSPELQRALEPLLAGIEAVSERICEYNERIEQLAQQSYPQTALPKQAKGVGTLIALTYKLTLEGNNRRNVRQIKACRKNSRLALPSLSKEP